MRNRLEEYQNLADAGTRMTGARKHGCSGSSESNKNGGQGEIRTRGLYHAKVTIFQLIYLPNNSVDRVMVYKHFQ